MSLRPLAIYGAGHVCIEDWFVRQGNRGSVALMADHCDSITISRTRTDPLSPVAALAVGTQPKGSVQRVRISDSHFDRSGIDREARLVDLDFGPGPESLEVALFDEADIPWETLAFRTIARTLRNYFLDRKLGAFPARISSLVRRPPIPPNLRGAG